MLDATEAMGNIYGQVPVELLRPRPDMEPDFMPTEEIMSPERRAAFEAAQEALTVRLQQMAAQYAGHLPPPREVRGTVRKIVAQEASDAMLVVAGAAGSSGGSLARDAVEAVLFDARAPLLLLPERAPGLPGRTAAVAWERSQAADEAIEAALPLLLAAERVVILVANEDHRRADLPGGLVEALRQVGPEPVIRRFPLVGRDIGDAILAEAREEGADLLVMGAFTHPRVLEALFGGATREVLEGARIPLLLHH